LGRGAGLRAAIEALGRALGGVVSKSLLGKAHNGDGRGGKCGGDGECDSGTVGNHIFRDTMRAGKLLNKLLMAQLHAQEAPERVKELEQWGALFDRTEDGRILQRAFARHTFRRLCHVGDRTGWRMIRTLRIAEWSMGFDVYMECTIVRLLTYGGRCAGALAYWGGRGDSCVQGEVGGDGHGWNWESLADHVELGE